MRDLIGDLVRRTLRPELAVQPRLQSRYEIRDDREDRTAMDTPAATLRAMHQPADDDAATGRPPSAAQRGAPTRSAQDRAESRGRPDPTHDSDWSARSGRTASATSTPPPPAADVAVLRATPVPVGVGRARDLTPPPPPTAPSTPPATRVAADPNPALARPTPAAVDRTAPATATVRRSVAAVARGDRSESQSRPAVPDIHISIGRIEVRATPANATGVQRQVGTARVGQSLNEYLDTRVRGGRR